MILSFLGMVWYCVKGFNLMVGFAIMATFWTALALVGNAFSPTSAMEGKTFIQVLADTGIAATLIRKVVELGGDKPRITMALLCIVTAIIFMSMNISPTATWNPPERP